jgi:hypothetical protein
MVLLIFLWFAIFIAPKSLEYISVSIVGKEEVYEHKKSQLI